MKFVSLVIGCGVAATGVMLLGIVRLRKAHPPSWSADLPPVELGEKVGRIFLRVGLVLLAIGCTIFVVNLVTS